MKAKKILFFNNKGGVGKTTLVYHLAYMLAELQIRTLAVDLDPQSNLTVMMVPDERLVEMYSAGKSILNTLEPVFNGEGFPESANNIEEINPYLGLIPGHLTLSRYEDNFGDAWLKCLNHDVRAFGDCSIFNRLIHQAVEQFDAQVVLVDVGPNLGAINRIVTISSDYLIIPVATDLFSVQGMENLGQRLAVWQEEWKARRARIPPGISAITKQYIPEDTPIKPIGYILMQFSARDTQPVKAYSKWAHEFPETFRKFILKEETTAMASIEQESDTHCVAQLKHNRSLAPLSMTARRPMFLLKPADGAIGSHLAAVRRVYEEYEKLTREILHRCDFVYSEAAEV
ncbi:MAG: AAA family ATPase [Gammaproteobacteria bacterium]|nr:AAA family ATPase [Gammaproteobacteria bacterium]